MTKLKLVAVLLLVLVAGWAGYKLAPSPVAETKTVHVDKVVYKDRVVTKDVVRTETRPDGTKIVTETKVKEAEKVSTVTKSTQKSEVSVASYKPKYSLGVSLRPESIFPMRGIYTVELGRRVGDSPLWVTASATTKKEFTIGLRIEF